MFGLSFYNGLWQDAIRGTIVTALLVSFSDPHYAISLSIGAVFAALSEAGQPFGHRWLTMLLTTLGMMLTAFLGSLISEIVWLAIVVTIPITFISAYIGTFGKRAAVGGLLSLIVFTIYVGVPVPEDDAFISAALIGAGGLAQTIATVLIGWLRREYRQKVTYTFFPHPIRYYLTDTEMLRHALRLTLMLTIATAISENISIPHPYWLPMSVAWMSKLGRHETEVRVSHRLIGSVIGIILAVLITIVFAPDEFGFPFFSMIGVLLTIAFIWVHYAVAVTGVTLWIIMLLGLIAEPIIPTVSIRLLWTVTAAIFVYIGMWLIPEIKPQKKQ